MYFDSESRYLFDYGVHLPLTVSAILVLYNVTCYIYMRKFANFFILFWIHMDAHEYVFVFQNLNILCIFSDRFFLVPVLWVDWFNDWSGSGKTFRAKHYHAENEKLAVSTMIFVVRVRGLSKKISESCLDLGKNQDFPR
jgi:hypothetical protein